MFICAAEARIIVLIVQLGTVDERVDKHTEETTPVSTAMMHVPCAHATPPPPPHALLQPSKRLRRYFQRARRLRREHTPLRSEIITFLQNAVTKIGDTRV